MFNESKVADGSHLSKTIKYRDISATVGPVLTKVVTMTHIGPLQMTDS